MSSLPMETKFCKGHGCDEQVHRQGHAGVWGAYCKACGSSTVRMGLRNSPNRIGRPPLKAGTLPKLASDATKLRRDADRLKKKAAEVLAEYQKAEQLAREAERALVEKAGGVIPD